MPPREFHFGFTGTQDGLTVHQAQMLAQFLDTQRTRMGEHLDGDFVTVLHHGDCVGADAEAHLIAAGTGWAVELHPGTDDKGESPKRAHSEDQMHEHVWRVHEPAPYPQRNLDIVMASVMLVACPKGPEKRRSGTWSTVRAALRLGRPVVLLHPDDEPEMLGMEDHHHE